MVISENNLTEQVELVNNLNADDFMEMMDAVGWTEYSREQVERALRGSLFLTKAVCDGQIVGMGRVVGDGSITFVLKHICVKPGFRGRGIGSAIVEKLKSMIESSVGPGERARIDLVPTLGNEDFYGRLGFARREGVSETLSILIDKRRA